MWDPPLTWTLSSSNLGADSLWQVINPPALPLHQLLGLPNPALCWLPMTTSSSPSDQVPVLHSGPPHPLPAQARRINLLCPLIPLGRNYPGREGKGGERANLCNMNVSKIWICWPHAPIGTLASILWGELDPSRCGKCDKPVWSAKNFKMFISSVDRMVPVILKE